jgi:RNA polymerase sigma-70 factor (ECF subfamily)
MNDQAVRQTENQPGDDQAEVLATDPVEFLATDQAIRQYQNMVYAIALTHTRRQQDADDVFQEVFLIYHRKRPEFYSEQRRRAWLITTTLNCSKQLTGSSWSKKVIPISFEQTEALSEESFQFRSDEQDAIFRAMQVLSPVYRSVIHLFYFEDLSISSIAETLGIKPGTVRVRLVRGRAQMKSLLKGADFDE